MKKLIRKILKEEIDTFNEPNTPNNELVQSDWFDIDMSKMDAYNQRYIENLKKTNSFDKWFKSISEKSFRRYPKLNKVAARDNGTLVGDFYLKGDEKVSVIKRSAKRIHFSDGRVVTITKTKTYGFEYFVGKNVNQILRDIEGYFVYLIHCKKEFL